MVALAASGERKFVRYKQQDADAVYVAGQKVYGKNLWRFANSGSNDYGTSTVDIMDGGTDTTCQHYKFTVTSIASDIWSRVIQGLYPSGTSTTYDTNKNYTTSFWIKPSLNRIRVYIYLGALASNQPITNQTNWVSKIVDVVPNEWNFITYTRKAAGQDAATSSRSLIGIRYLQSDHAGVNLIGQTIEIKELKAEEYEYSPYSLHALYF